MFHNDCARVISARTALNLSDGRVITVVPKGKRFIVR